MKILNQLKLLGYQLFLTVNPVALLIILATSFFSDKYALLGLKIEHWVFGITLIWALPLIYEKKIKESEN